MKQSNDGVLPRRRITISPPGATHRTVPCVKCKNRETGGGQGTGCPAVGTEVRCRRADVGIGPYGCVRNKETEGCSKRADVASAHTGAQGVRRRRRAASGPMWASAPTGAQGVRRRRGAAGGPMWALAPTGWVFSEFYEDKECRGCLRSPGGVLFGFQRISCDYSLSASMARYRKVTTWPLVQVPSGAKVVAVMPLVTLLATAQATAFS